MADVAGTRSGHRRFRRQIAGLARGVAGTPLAASPAAAHTPVDFELGRAYMQLLARLGAHELAALALFLGVFVSRDSMRLGGWHVGAGYFPCSRGRLGRGSRDVHCA